MTIDVSARVRSGGALTAVAAAFTLLACSGSGATTDTQTASALSSETEGVEALAPCLTRYVECVRGGEEGRTCHETFHVCARPEGREGGGPRPPLEGRGEREPGARDCDGGGERAPRPEAGDGYGVRPPPPPDGDVRRPEGDHLPPPPEGAVEGPRACFEALDTCARGSEAVEACVSAGVACLSALPRPARPPHEPREPREPRDTAESSDAIR